jgi:hypothetical protein
MRTLTVLLLIGSLSSPALADGPDEPKQTAQPAPAPAPAPAVVAPASSSSSTTEVVKNPPKVWAWAFGGAAIGSIILGGALGGAALARSNEQEGNPANPPLYTKQLQKNANEGEALATAGYVFIGVGAALAVVDAVIWYECYRKPRKNVKSAAAQVFATGVRF